MSTIPPATNNLFELTRRLYSRRARIRRYSLRVFFQQNSARMAVLKQLFSTDATRLICQPGQLLRKIASNPSVMQDIQRIVGSHALICFDQCSAKPFGKQVRHLAKIIQSVLGRHPGGRSQGTMRHGIAIDKIRNDRRDFHKLCIAKLEMLQPKEAPIDVDIVIFAVRIVAHLVYRINEQIEKLGCSVAQCYTAVCPGYADIFNQVLNDVLSNFRPVVLIKRSRAPYAALAPPIWLNAITHRSGNAHTGLPLIRQAQGCLIRQFKSTVKPRNLEHAKTFGINQFGLQFREYYNSGDTILNSPALLSPTASAHVWHGQTCD